MEFGAAQTDEKKQAGAPEAEAEPEIDVADMTPEQVTEALDEAETEVNALADRLQEEFDESVAAVEGTDEIAALDGLDMDAVREQIDGIVNAAPEAMTEAERLTALKALATELNAMIADAEGVEAGEAGATENAAEDDAAIAEMQAELDAAAESIEQLTGELAAKQADIESLNAQIETLNAQSETDAEQVAALEKQLTEAMAQADAKRAELDGKTADYEKQMDALRAYVVSRDPVAGEAYAATGTGSEIAIEADGVTGAWEYVNNDISGNPVVLTLQLEGETIYTSGALKPGQTLDTIKLNKALAAGEYEALAVTTITDEAGEVLFANRVPVTLRVAG